MTTHSTHRPKRGAIAHCCTSSILDNKGAGGNSGNVQRAKKNQLGYTLRAIDELQAGDHICFLYENVEEHRTVTTQFVRGGIAQNHKIVYIGDAVTRNSVLNYFANSSIDIQALITKGQFEFLTYDQAYVIEGRFDPDAMVKMLQQTVDDALERGFEGERVMGEMTWILKHLKDYDEVVRYESMVNKLFEENNALAICQYNRHLFDSQLLLNIINVHPLACVGMDLYDNFYYIPPSEWHSDDKPAVFLKYWLRNLRDRKKVEEELNHAKEVALSESKAKTEFLNSMSHEIRTPLNGLIGTAQILKETMTDHVQAPSDASSLTPTSPRTSVADPDSSVQTLLKTMEICSNHLLSVVNDVLDLSRIPHSVGEGKEFSLFQCIDEALQIVSPRARSKNITLTLDIDSQIRTELGQEGRIAADESGLRKVLINLIGNGTKFTNPGGEIRIEVGRKGKGEIPKEILANRSYSTCPFEEPRVGSESLPSSSPTEPFARMQISSSAYTRLHFIVQDNGIGISRENLPSIFRAFSRVENARDSSDKPIEGTGLGLVISKQLVSRMGGDMWVESDGVGKGTRFQFWIWVKKAGKDELDFEESHSDSTLVFPRALADTTSSSSSSISSTSSKSKSSASPTSTKSVSTTSSHQTSKSTPPWHNGGERKPNLHILIADDNPINCRILNQFLKSFKYQHIQQCEDGLSAIAYVQSLLPPTPPPRSSSNSFLIPQNLPSIILLDYKMPHLTGSETAGKLRELYRIYGLPQPFMACLTAAVLEEELKDCMENGIQEVMIKPLRWSDVGERVWRWAEIVEGRWRDWEKERGIMSAQLENGLGSAGGGNGLGGKEMAVLIRDE
ncbi:hypothetical protein HDV00_009950 [Rhizophlyctis rosea]|nr:hypothetical protein HDV00_009950 [Rhizophlyctis rosea]